MIVARLFDEAVVFNKAVGWLAGGAARGAEEVVEAEVGGAAGQWLAEVDLLFELVVGVFPGQGLVEVDFRALFGRIAQPQVPFADAGGVVAGGFEHRGGGESVGLD